MYHDYLKYQQFHQDNRIFDTHFQLWLLSALQIVTQISKSIIGISSSFYAV